MFENVKSEIGPFFDKHPFVTIIIGVAAVCWVTTIGAALFSSCNGKK